MQKTLRLIWSLIFLLSLVWAVGGALVASGALDDNGTASDMRGDIIVFMDGLNVPPELPLPIVFALTGAPIALLSLYLAMRNQRGLGNPVAEKAKPGGANRGALAITALSLAFALLLWNAGRVDAMLAQQNAPTGDLSLTAVTYPVRLFVTFVHEAGHSLAALLTGGQVKQFTVSPDGSGYAVTSGGNIALVLPAGYLGAALFGSLLFLLSSRAPALTRGLSLALGIGMIALTLLFARPDASGNITAQVVGVGYGVALALLGWFAPQGINVFLLNTLAILTGLNAVFDLARLVPNADLGNGAIVNDAARFAQEITPGLHPSIIAILWAAIAVGHDGRGYVLRLAETRAQ